jgi:large subunit ribosomal protein L24
MPKTHVKKGDTVIVLSGQQRGTKGKVTEVDPTKQRVVVEGVNVHKRHTKPKPPANPQGGIVEKTLPIHLSNVMLVDPKKDGLPTRIKYKTEGDKKVRVSVRTGQTV